MKQSAPVFILINPQMAENIGAAARAALNFGVQELRIVNPRDGWPNERAEAMAAGALDIMKLKIYKTPREAFAGLHYLYATTARTRDMSKPVFTAEKAALDAVRRQKKKQKTGFVFGPERTGLENDDLALCHSVLTIPTNPDFFSLNLAQCASVVAYELSKADGLKSPASKAAHIPAPFEAADEALTRLETELEDKGFFKSPAMKPTMKRNLRAMLLRAEWSEQETRTFHGILSALTGKNAKRGHNKKQDG